MLNKNLHAMFSLLWTLAKRFLKASIFSLWSWQQLDPSGMLTFPSRFSSPSSLISSSSSSSSSLLYPTVLWKCRPLLGSEGVIDLLGLTGVLSVLCGALSLCQSGLAKTVSEKAYMCLKLTVCMMRCEFQEHMHVTITIVVWIKL